MPKKEKKTTKKETIDKRERQIKVLRDNVYEIFDRVPNGSITADLGALIDKINKA